MNANATPAIGAVILAAGMSTRMGEAKQLLPIGGITFLERVLATVHAARINDAVLVLGFVAGSIGKLRVGEGVKVVRNARYREGMASSLQAGLATLNPSTAAALIVLADQPLVRPETLNRIAAEYGRRRCQISIPTYHGLRGNPVLVDRSLFSEIMALTGDTGARAIFARHPEGIVRVPVDDPGILLDIDSRQDLEDLERWQRAGGEERAGIEAAILRRRERAQDLAEEDPTGRDPGKAEDKTA